MLRSAGDGGAEGVNWRARGCGGRPDRGPPGPTHGGENRPHWGPSTIIFRTPIEKAVSIFSSHVPGKLLLYGMSHVELAICRQAQQSHLGPSPTSPLSTTLRSLTSTYDHTQ
ncbi:hypothetical protein BT67DRAFT_7566 [Trichocladium antarcticum]|uniref:Uncharacterized protein n=1 Tax=Trichocladium antarcticum TaxID=1450529 RepID=A0AAN6USX2_9PEZI|nr:hypothetical protein BT67DRAFT_7566 [Trichocladium antarcticum]